MTSTTTPAPVRRAPRSHSQGTLTPDWRTTSSSRLAESWSVSGIDVQGAYYNGAGPAFSVNLFVYTDDGGALSDELVAQASSLPFTGGPNFVVDLPSPIALSAGTYWLALAAVQDFNSTGQWGWTDRTMQVDAGCLLDGQQFLREHLQRQPCRQARRGVQHRRSRS